MPRLDLVERVVDGAAAVPRKILRPAPHPHMILPAAYVDGRLRRRCAHPLGALARREVGEGGRAERGGHAWPRRPVRAAVPAGWPVDAAGHPVGGRPPAERRKPKPHVKAAARGRKGALPCLSTATRPFPPRPAGCGRPNRDPAGRKEPCEAGQARQHPRARPRADRVEALAARRAGAALEAIRQRRHRASWPRAAAPAATRPCMPPPRIPGACSVPCRACRSSARPGRAALSRSAGSRLVASAPLFAVRSRRAALAIGRRSPDCAAPRPAPDRRHGPRASRPLRAACGAIGRAHSAAGTPRRRGLSGRRLPPSRRPASRYAIDDRPPAAAFCAASSLPLPPIAARLSHSLPEFWPKNPPASSFCAPAPYIHTATI